MASVRIIILLEAWQEHQLTNRELITEARQLTPEDRRVLHSAVQHTIVERQVAAAAKS